MTRRYRFHGAEFDPPQHELRVRDQVHRLTPRLHALMELLVESGGRVVTKDEILDSVWKDAFVTEGSVGKAIGALRQMLGTGRGDTEFIETIPAVGYRFVPVVEIVETDDRPQEPVVAGNGSPRLKLWPRVGVGALALVAVGMLLLGPAARDSGDSSYRTVPEAGPFEGFVTVYRTDEPVAGLEIRLRPVVEGTGDDPRSDELYLAMSDEAGRFRLADSVPSGVYRLEADDGRYELLRPAAQAADAPAIRVGPNRRIEPRTVHVRPVELTEEGLATISGRVLSSDGRELTGDIELFRRQYDGGEYAVVHVEPVRPAYPIYVNGRYELHVAPGEYLVSAAAFGPAPWILRAADGAPLPRTSFPHFYPGVTSPDDALVIRVDPGDTVSDADIVITPTEETYRVFVELDLSAVGGDDPPVQVRLRHAGIPTLMPGSYFEYLGDGRFRSMDTPPGRYVAEVMNVDYGNMEMVEIVDADVDLGTIRPTASMAVTGRITGADAHAAADANVSMVLETEVDKGADLRVLSSPIHADGTFGFVGIPEGFYRLRAREATGNLSPPGPSYYGVARVNRQFVPITEPASALEAVLWQRRIRLDGLVRNKDGGIQPFARIAAVTEAAASSERPAFRFADADAYGRFSILLGASPTDDGAARYLLFAYAYRETGGPEPELLHSIASDLTLFDAETDPWEDFKITTWDR